MTMLRLKTLMLEIRFCCSAFILVNGDDMTVRVTARVTVSAGLVCERLRVVVA